MLCCDCVAFGVGQFETFFYLAPIYSYSYYLILHNNNTGVAMVDRHRKITKYTIVTRGRYSM